MMKAHVNEIPTMYTSPPTTPPASAKPIGTHRIHTRPSTAPSTDAPPLPPRNAVASLVSTLSDLKNTWLSSPAPASTRPPSKEACAKPSLSYACVPPVRLEGGANRAEQVDPQPYLFNEYLTEISRPSEQSDAFVPLSANLRVSPDAKRVFAAATRLVLASGSSCFTQPRVRVIDDAVAAIDQRKANAIPFGFPETIPPDVSWTLVDFRIALRTVEYIRTRAAHRPIIDTFNDIQNEFLAALAQAPGALDELDEMGHFSDLPRDSDASFVFRSVRHLLKAHMPRARDAMTPAASASPALSPAMITQWSTARETRC